jgi:hypothetical protein
METVAMYWEPQIKTYGFQVVKNLTLYKYSIPADLPIPWERAIERLEEGQNRFQLLCAQLRASSDLELRLLCEPEQGVSLAGHIEAEIPAVADRRQVTTPVELLFFQGPHFGDRFGIADFTFKALKEKADLLLAVVFACASIYLILPEGAADETKTCLAAAFRIPD